MVLFILFKDPNHPKLTIKAGLADDLILSYPLDRRAQQGRGRAQLLNGCVHENLELGAEGVDQLAVDRVDLLGGRPATKELTQHFRQGDQAMDRRGALGPQGLLPISQLHDPVEHSDGHGPAALRADTFSLHGLGRFQADPAFAVAVAMVFALFRVEFHRGLETLLALLIYRITQGLLEGGKLRSVAKILTSRPSLEGE